MPNRTTSPNLKAWDPIFITPTRYGAVNVAVGNTPTVNRPPVACFTYDAAFNFVDFDASCSTDPDGNIVSWVWDFGDGDVGTGEIISHTYNAAGVYTVILTVTDDDGLTDTFSDTVTVTVVCGLTFTFDQAGASKFLLPVGVTSIWVDESDNGGILHHETGLTASNYYSFTINSGGTVVICIEDDTATWNYNSSNSLANSGVGEWWNAPDQTKTIRITARGGAGAGSGSSAGGLGGQVIVDYTPAPGSYWAVWAAGAGGVAPGGNPGGGSGWIANNQGSGGGGLSSFQPATSRINHLVDLSDSIVVAPGGGGGSDPFFNPSKGGDGRYVTGESAGGGGGTQFAGGAGVHAGTDGSFGTGGAGQNPGAFAAAEGGGGGAGWYGGGAGGFDAATSGGGGGSGHKHASAILVSSSDGVVTGVGSVTIVIS